MKEIHIQIIISMASILLAAFLSYYFSKRKYNYEKLFDKKLVYLEKIYSKVVSLEKDLNKYIITIGGSTQKSDFEEKKEEVEKLRKSFFDLQEFFWKKQIILEDSSVKAIQDFISLFIEKLGKLSSSLISESIGDNKVSREQWESVMNSVCIEDEFKIVKKRLEDDFRKTIKK